MGGTGGHFHMKSWVSKHINDPSLFASIDQRSWSGGLPEDLNFQNKANPWTICLHIFTHFISSILTKDVDRSNSTIKYAPTAYF